MGGDGETVEEEEKTEDKGLASRVFYLKCNGFILDWLKLLV